MNLGILGITDDLRSQRFYHGTRADLKPGDLIEPGDLPGVDERDRMTTYVYLTPNLDAAIWGAELAVGEGPGRDIVEPIGQIEEALDLTNQKSRGPSVDVMPLPRALAGHGRDHGLAGSLPLKHSKP